MFIEHLDSTQVPLTTLRDDIRVSVDCTRSGPEPILSQLEESKLVAHIKEQVLGR